MIFKSLMKSLKYTKETSACRAIAIGVSAGGMAALGKLVPVLPETFSHILIVVQHLYSQNESMLHQYLDRQCRLKVKEAEDKDAAIPGIVYTAPANYHLLVESDETFALSVDEKANYSRPSIDVLFESAARVWETRLTGIVLTGANRDGAFGLKEIKRFGGLTIAQDPATAEFSVMPQAAIDTGAVDRIMTLEAIGDFLVSISDGQSGQQPE